MEKQQVYLHHYSEGFLQQESGRLVPKGLLGRSKDQVVWDFEVLLPYGFC
jgi:hypothetical protein